LANTVYEGLFLLDSGRYSRDPEGISGQIAQMVQEAGGEMLVSRLWEERRLAYTIKGHRKGTYWLTYFRIDGEQLAAINRKCRLNESILRVLFTKFHPSIVDAAVEHARTGSLKPIGARAEELHRDKPGEDKPAKTGEAEPSATTEDADGGGTDAGAD
jgi:small subunit ribosomal protein S6